MKQDALERLRNRVKPTVEKRDLSSIPQEGSERQQAPTSSVLQADVKDLQISEVKHEQNIESLQTSFFSEKNKDDSEQKLHSQNSSSSDALLEASQGVTYNNPALVAGDSPSQAAQPLEETPIIWQASKVAPSVSKHSEPLENQTDISNSSFLDVKISTNKNISTSVSTCSESSLATTEIKTKQSTIRLEETLTQKISQKCREEGISREVFLEALFVYFETHKSIQPKVVAEARKRDVQRQKIANYRRAKSMIERFGSLKEN